MNLLPDHAAVSYTVCVTFGVVMLSRSDVVSDCANDVPSEATHASIWNGVFTKMSAFCSRAARSTASSSNGASHGPRSSIGVGQKLAGATVSSFGGPDPGFDAKPWADASSETRSIAEYIMVAIMSGCCEHERLW